jgi:hypothetical protein
MAQTKQVTVGSNATELPLLKFESHWMMQYQWPITTLQFYTGDAEKAATFLKGRLTEVAQLNPWIGAKLVKDPKKHGKLLALHYDKENPPIDDMFQVNNDLKLTPDVPYEDLVKAVSSSTACVPNGGGLIKEGTPVSKLTVAPNGDGSFAVIFSMSHTVGDGHTYYTILSQLSSGAEPFAMEVNRMEKAHEAIPSVTGEKEYKFMMNPPFCMLCHYMGIYFKYKKKPPACFILDTDKLKAAKESAKAESGAPPYVTTNDIVTSGFARAVKAKMITVAANFRGRAEGLTDKHAGNYFGGLMYGTEGAATPNRIRTALNGPAPLSRCELPGCCISGNWSAMISNWSSMSKGDLLIPDCTQTLHLPYLNIKEMMEDSCIVFKARPGQVAVMLFLQNCTVDDVKRELPLGEPVSAKMFGA